MVQERIVIVHPDGRNAAVLPKDFEAGIDGDYKGFKATAYESGEPYEGPKTARTIKAEDAPAKAEQPQGAKKAEK
jgi:hypothetical protein